MIIDVYTHAWSYPGHFDDDFREQAIPVLLHTSTTFVSQAPSDCTLPRQLDAASSLELQFVTGGHAWRP